MTRHDPVDETKANLPTRLREYAALPNIAPQFRSDLTHAANEIERLRVAIFTERQRCHDIALAIDSNRGNEKQIAKAILAGE